jgi:ketosteroid isomerase-like protein
VKNHDLLKATYAAFNRRDVDAALAAMHPQVEWPNGMEGGTLRGHRAVRQYWIRQWTTINPRVEPLGFEEEKTGHVMVRVHEVVHDLQGAMLVDRMICHDYAFEDELIKSMEIKEPS